MDIEVWITNYSMYRSDRIRGTCRGDGFCVEDSPPAAELFQVYRWSRESVGHQERNFDLVTALTRKPPDAKP